MSLTAHRFELLRSMQFRLAAAFVAGTAAVSLLLFAFVYWQTAGFISHRVRILLEETATHAATQSDADVTRQVTLDIASDPLHVVYEGLFSATGRSVAGNLVQIPDNLPPDGHTRRLRGEDFEPDLPPSVYAIGVAETLRSGNILVLARDVKAVEALRGTVLRALGLGLVPAFGLLLLIGLLLGRRALTRITTVQRKIERIMRGDLHERLPTTSSRDEIDRLSHSVNRMLDELERLLREVKGVGDSVAHELRTPLARARARLERGRHVANSLASLQTVVDTALADLDQTVALIRAVLRVGEIEAARRRGGFGPVDLAALARDAYDLFQPVAEEQGRTLTLATEEVPPVDGDAELLLEAVGNLVDNALKYTWPGGSIWIEVTREDGLPAIRVADDGPGIPFAERAALFQRFHRGARQADVPGYGLGLSIVEAIIRMHGFRMDLRDRPEGGALFVISTPSALLSAPSRPRPPMSRQHAAGSLS